MTDSTPATAAPCPPCARGQHRDPCVCPCHKPTTTAAPLLINPEYEDAARYNTFRLALTGLINEHSMENGSDTPDFLLAEYLMECLGVWDRSVKAREEWFGRKVSDWAGGFFDAD